MPAYLLCDAWGRTLHSCIQEIQNLAMKCYPLSTIWISQPSILPSCSKRDDDDDANNDTDDDKSPLKLSLDLYFSLHGYLNLYGLVDINTFMAPCLSINYAATIP